MHPHLLARFYLGWHAFASLYFGTELLAAPVRLISGPATTCIYQIAPPALWGALFVALAVVCAVAAYRPRDLWRVAIIALGGAQILWALALFVPLFFGGRTNLLASSPWISLAVTSLIVARHTYMQETHPHPRCR